MQVFIVVVVIVAINICIIPTCGRSIISIVSKSFR